MSKQGFRLICINIIMGCIKHTALASQQIHLAQNSSIHLKLYRNICLPWILLPLHSHILEVLGKDDFFQYLAFLKHFCRLRGLGVLDLRLLVFLLNKALPHQYFQILIIPYATITLLGNETSTSAQVYTNMDIRFPKNFFEAFHRPKFGI